MPAADRRSACLRHVLVFFAVLAGVEWTLDRVASPFQGADKIERKFAYFAAHKDEYDCVFVGSSRVMNQLSPRIFDQTMAAAGHSCRSINLGYAGMFLPESCLLIERIRELRPARLRTMVVELSTHTPRRDEEQTLTAREVYWHRAPGTALACATILTDSSSDFPVTERLGQLARQGMLFARCHLHLGAGVDLIEHLQAARTGRPAAGEAGRDTLGPALDGFAPLVTTLGQGASSATKTGGTSADLSRYQAAVSALQAAVTNPPRSEPAYANFGRSVMAEIVRRQAVSLHAARIEPTYFVAPVTTREQLFLDLAAAGAVPKLLAFNDPVAFPELYEPAVRADLYHLNVQGAERLTRLLAQRMGLPSRIAPENRPGRFSVDLHEN